MTTRRTFLKTSLISLPLIASEQVFAEPPSPEVFRKPVVVSTWDKGIRANAAAWKVLEKDGRAIDAVEEAARSAEDEASCCASASMPILTATGSSRLTHRSWTIKPIAAASYTCSTSSIRCPSQER